MLLAQNKNMPKYNHIIKAPAFNIGGFFNSTGVTKVLFNKKKSIAELPPLLSESEVNGASYDQVLDFLVGINDDDYSKVLKVAEIYRKANQDVAQATGLEYEAQPSIFDRQEAIEARHTTAPATDTEAGNFLDDDDDLATAFLSDDDEPVTQIPVKTTATAKTPKNETANLQS